MAAEQVGEAEEFVEGQILEVAFGQLGFDGLLVEEQALELGLVEGGEGEGLGRVHRSLEFRLLIFDWGPGRTAREAEFEMQITVDSCR